MFKIPDYYDNVSLRLSEVFDDIGVNEKTVLMRRHDAMLKESLMTISSELTNSAMSSYIFGSQIEGTTTRALNSDEDILNCFSRFNVIDDLTRWIPGLQNMLAVKFDNTCPGYCLLQPLRVDAPLPLRSLSDEPLLYKHLSMDNFQRVIFKNTWLNDLIPEGEERNGPSITSKLDSDFHTQDIVAAYPYHPSPAEAGSWFKSKRSKRWPIIDMEEAVKTNGCFVVPVGKKGSENEESEWRISTSFVERSLMFSWNIHK
ncbi:uncharacterized protein LOC123525529 [Mercenaria mercenaria]|uniref:uncharacterized protein LOC123525529 n=1 Tax=Mercenaria mercenaria TaxID=6596 RepID=UPI00234EBA0C|nr:uncharacterized protein LOC123525529 [Mercenaria mercenaria]